MFTKGELRRIIINLSEIKDAYLSQFIIKDISELLIIESNNSNDDEEERLFLKKSNESIKKRLRTCKEPMNAYYVGKIISIFEYYILSDKE